MRSYLIFGNNIAVGPKQLPNGVSESVRCSILL